MKSKRPTLGSLASQLFSSATPQIEQDVNPTTASNDMTDIDGVLLIKEVDLETNSDRSHFRNKETKRQSISKHNYKSCISQDDKTHDFTLNEMNDLSKRNSSEPLRPTISIPKFTFPEKAISNLSPPNPKAKKGNKESSKFQEKTTKNVLETVIPDVIEQEKEIEPPRKKLKANGKFVEELSRLGKFGIFVQDDEIYQNLEDVTKYFDFAIQLLPHSTIDTKSFMECVSLGAKIELAQLPNWQNSSIGTAILITPTDESAGSVGKGVLDYIQNQIDTEKAQSAFWKNGFGKIPNWVNKESSKSQTKILIKCRPSTSTNEDASLSSWLTIYAMSRRNENVVPVLYIDSPNQIVDFTRWLAEPVYATIISTDTFTAQANGKNLRLKSEIFTFVRELCSCGVHVIIEDTSQKMTSSIQYKKFQKWFGTIEDLFIKELTSLNLEYSYPLRDILQEPLQVLFQENFTEISQPLSANMSKEDYLSLEKCPVKYKKYGQAIKRALYDLKSSNPHSEIIVFVLGAGRGPLVSQTIMAAAGANAIVKIFAVDKNPTAIEELEIVKKKYRWDNVEIVKTDMRLWETPYRADLIVSELLGSFGDNELSPECLYEAEKLLRDEKSIMIPTSYTSYLAPISSHELWKATLNENNDYINNKQNINAFEKPYVVNFHRVAVLCSPQPCFKFTHPVREEKENLSSFLNLRKLIQFTIKSEAFVHGFGGFFDCILYKEVKFTILPQESALANTTDALSEDFARIVAWYPMYFPLKQPVEVRKGDLFEATFWRCHTAERVWYEYVVNRPIRGDIHNSGGSSYSILIPT